jgi:lipoate-protein ligase B
VPNRVLLAGDLGVVPYALAAALQEALAESRRLGSADDTVLLLEHPPVITLGRRGSLDDVYLPVDELARGGIDVVRSSRGGLVTYHGPGQVVAYPIVRLRAVGLTVPCYVHGLEAAVIRALAEVGVHAFLRPEHIGVWTEQGKIAAVGVGQRHGVTMHGVAVNLQPELAHFGLINPCGLGDLGVTSVAKLIGRTVDVGAFKRLLAEELASELGLRLSWHGPPAPWSMASEPRKALQ